MIFGVPARGGAYAIAVAFVAIATVVRFLIAPQEAGFPYVTYFPAATLAAIVGGLWPGLFATLLGAFAAVFLFVEPVNAVKFSSEAVISALVFVVDEIIVCSAIEAMRRYHHRYAEAAEALAQAHGRLEQAHDALEKSHEAERAARQAAERAAQAKSRFLSAASHDLRQPLQALRLFLTLLSGSGGATQLPSVLPRMDEAMKATERLLNSILDLGRVEAGIVRIEPTELSLGEVLGDFRLEFTDLAAQAGTKLVIVDCSLTVRADRVVVQRILANLLSNALKYGAGGRVLVGCRRHGSTVRVEVWDEGPGVPEDKRELVFEEFFQIGNSERDLSQGLGIGLAIARRLAKLSGFRLWLESPARGGACFCVSMDDAVVQASPVEIVQRETDYGVNDTARAV